MVTWATIAGFYTDWAKEVTKTFTERTGIEVKIEAIDLTTMFEKEMIEMAGRTGAYDIVTCELLGVAEWAHKGWLEPLDNYIAKTPPEEIQIDDILPHWRAGLTYGGHLYGLPYYTYDQGVFYRADLFEREDIKDMYRKWTGGEELKKPSHLMTWDEAIKVAKFFDEVVPDDIVPYGIGLMASPANSNDEFFAMLWSIGGDVFDKDYNIIVDNELGVKAANIYLQLLKHAPPGALASSYDEVVAQMQRGLIAMTGPFFLDQWPNMVKTEKMVPGAKIECNTPIGGRGYYGCFVLALTSSSKNKDAAWEFLKFITGPEGQYSFAKGGGSTCRKSVLLNPEFDPDVNPASRPYTGHFKKIYESAMLYWNTAPDWQKPYRMFKLTIGMTMYLHSQVTVGSITAGTVSPEGALKEFALALSMYLGWPAGSHSPPPGWKPPPD
jgi:multiple sugar transport system substrate-binding protein